MNANQPISRKEIAGVVVLYNSSPDSFTNIQTYTSQVDTLYVIDNSPVVSPWVIDKLRSRPQVVYTHFPQNVGMATALNTAARNAIRDGYRYLLTMDDDSHAPADMIAKMIQYLTVNQPETIGIVSPRHILSATNQVSPALNQPEAVDVLTTMTSGNLVNLEAYETVGGFWDDLFIDVVDHEFNLRLKTTGYRIVELPDLKLLHRLGTPRQLPFLGLSYVRHSPVRNYYLIRNSLIVARRHVYHYPFYLLTALMTIAIEITKVALLEDERLLRLRLAGRAIADGLKNRTGKLGSRPEI